MYMFINFTFICVIFIINIKHYHHARTSVVVEVNFKESSYHVNESAGQVQVTLMVTGQFFKEVNATVECVEGNATGWSP